MDEGLLWNQQNLTVTTVNIGEAFLATVILHVDTPERKK
jgi:hypothetical protein